MSNNPVDENFYEQVLIALFKEMGYQYECGYDVERDYREPFLAEDLRKGLRRLNPMVSNTVLEDALRLITNVNEGTLEQRNEQLLRGMKQHILLRRSSMACSLICKRIINIE